MTETPESSPLSRMRQLPHDSLSKLEKLLGNEGPEIPPALRVELVKIARLLREEWESVQSIYDELAEELVASIQAKSDEASPPIVPSRDIRIAETEE